MKTEILNKLRSEALMLPEAERAELVLERAPGKNS